MPTRQRNSGAAPVKRWHVTRLRWSPTRPGNGRCATALIVAEARRGEIWLIDFGEPLGHEQGWQRPGLVLSSNEWNRHATVVTVLPLTRTKHDLPTRVEIAPDRGNGLGETSYARCEGIRSVTERRIVQRIGVVDLVVMHSIAQVVRIFLEV